MKTELPTQEAPPAQEGTAPYWRFIGQYLHPLPDDVSSGLERVSADDAVGDLQRRPDAECDAILDGFLKSKGGELSELSATRMARDPDNTALAKDILADAAFEFSRAYKQVVMGPLAWEVAHEIVAADPDYVIDAPTASGRFQETVSSWYDDAVSAVVAQFQGSRLWERFQHATDTSSAVTFDFPRFGHVSLETGKYAPREYDTQLWLTKSFLNTVPFVSDLLIEAAVGYARHHPGKITPEALAKGVQAWLPHLFPLDSTYEGTQDIVTFGPRLVEKRRRHKEGDPPLPARWLSALKSYEIEGPEALQGCAAACASAPLLRMPQPGAIHRSLEKGRLPEEYSGYCGARFLAPVPRELESSGHHPHEGDYSINAAATMFRSCAKAAAKTIFADPACLEGIRFAAEVVEKASAASDEGVK